MAMPIPFVDRLIIKRVSPPGPVRPTQQGVVLIVALVLLVVISLLAVTSIQNAGSSESVSSNVRTTELATQAAEIALRYCEARAIEMHAADKSPLGILNQWKEMTIWDGSWSIQEDFLRNSTFVVKFDPTLDKQLIATFQRPPECMVEEQSTASSAASSASSTEPSTVTLSVLKFYTITARGFGPEVPALTGVNHIRPVGSEVWLQSTLEIEKNSSSPSP